MTAIMNRPDIPSIRPAKHAQPTWSGLFVAAARNVDRPWSIGVDALVLAAFFGLMCWEGWQFGLTGAWEHLAVATVVLVAGVMYAFRAFTAPDRSES